MEITKKLESNINHFLECDNIRFLARSIIKRIKEASESELNVVINSKVLSSNDLQIIKDYYIIRGSEDQEESIVWFYNTIMVILGIW